jgi:hypothetical protein
LLFAEQIPYLPQEASMRVMALYVLMVLDS